MIMNTITSLQFTININAPAEKVWQVLWNDETYRKWTTPFCEGSYAESDWQEGSPVQFLSPGGNGMYSRIQKMIPNQEMSFEHLGEVKNGEKQPTDWAGATERYILSEENGITHLKVETDVVENYMTYMNEAFPKALQVVKTLSEA